MKSSLNNSRPQGFFEDRQPNEVINRRNQQAPPAILLASRLPSQQSRGRGSYTRGRARGHSFTRGGSGGGRGGGRGGGFRGRGRGGFNVPTYQPQCQDHQSSHAGPVDDGKGYSVSTEVSQIGSGHPGTSHTPHRMPALKPNHSQFQRPAKAMKKRRQFAPIRPQKPPTEGISSAISHERAVTPSLFTPPPSPIRIHSPPAFQRSCSPVQQVEPAPAASPSSPPPPPPLLLAFDNCSSSRLAPSNPPDRHALPCTSPQALHAHDQMPKRTLSSDDAPSPTNLQQPATPHSPSKSYRNVAVQAEENEAPIVIIPRKRTLISSPVHGASALPDCSSKPLPSPKRQRMESPGSEFDGLELSYPEPGQDIKVESDLDISIFTHFTPDLPSTSCPAGQPTSIHSATILPDSLGGVSQVTPEPRSNLVSPSPESVHLRPSGVVVKQERSPSPVLPTENRQRVTSWAQRIALPPECQKSARNWQRYRSEFCQSKVRKLREKGLKVDKVFFRPDGMVIEWSSPWPVWSDTLEPTSPKIVHRTVTKSKYDDVEIIDLTSDEVSVASSQPHRDMPSSSTTRDNVNSKSSGDITANRPPSINNDPPKASPGIASFQASRMAVPVPPWASSLQGRSNPDTRTSILPNPYPINDTRPPSTSKSDNSRPSTSSARPVTSLRDSTSGHLSAPSIIPRHPSVATNPHPTPVAPRPQRSATAEDFLNVLRATAVTIHQHGGNTSRPSPSASVSPAPPAPPLPIPIPKIETIDEGPMVKRRKIEPALVQSIAIVKGEQDMKRTKVTKAQPIQPSGKKGIGKVWKASPSASARPRKVPLPSTSPQRVQEGSDSEDEDQLDDDSDGEDSTPLMKKLKQRRLRTTKLKKRNIAPAVSSSQERSHSSRVVASPSASDPTAPNSETQWNDGGHASSSQVSQPDRYPVSLPIHQPVTPWKPPARSLLPPRPPRSHGSDSESEDEVVLNARATPLGRSNTSHSIPSKDVSGGKANESHTSDLEDIEEQEVRKQLVLSRSDPSSVLQREAGGGMVVMDGHGEVASRVVVIDSRTKARMDSSNPLDPHEEEIVLGSVEGYGSG
ncbi:hypothetical protein PM082_010097 [Marasmius tenuissimus]|nr:hypothetical protein PM082_010097 [Marasmius tenuissimus]